MERNRIQFPASEGTLEPDERQFHLSIMASCTNRTFCILAVLLVTWGCVPIRPAPASPVLLPTLTPSISLPVIAELPKPTALLPTVSAEIPILSYQPVFELASCAFPVPAGYKPECGYLVVPENRARAGSNLIRLHVAIFRTHAGTAARDAVLHLAGGPGSSSLESADYLFSFGMGAVLRDRDLVLFDQRGTGYSQPRLDCPEREALAPVLLEGNLPVSGGQQAILDSFRQCRNRLLGQGVDISAYTSVASAADIDDLLSVLGYEHFDLYAVSYGTRLALTLLRDHPEAVRSAVLDSAYPLEVNLYTALAPNAQRAFEVFFGRCEQDPICSASFPDLRNVFFQLVEQFDQVPLLVSLSDRGTERSVNLDGGLLVDVLFTGLYNPAVTASMPQMIFDIRDGEYGILRKRLLLYFQHSSALGMLMAVQCNEELPFDSMDTAYAAAQGVQSQISTYYLGSIQPLFEACRDWTPLLIDPRENLAVSTGVPMLVFAGAGDPITPPAWGQMVAARQSTAYFYEFPGNGHWVTRSSDCALQMAFTFWNDPLTDPGWICQAH